MSIINAVKIAYEYIRRDEEGNVDGITRALDDVSFEVNQGDFIAILGANGSGKSTLAKHFNAIFYPTEGTVYVDGKDTKAEQNIWDIRQACGMVFQNPDNQIVGQVVEEDVGFGPENIGVPTDEIWERVDDSLKAVNMLEFRKKSPTRLSGGQKQRVSIAGVLAMKPKCIVLDEPTAMLDPIGREDILNAAIKLNREENITIILITHYMEEAANADKLIVMNKGKIALSGTPRQVFSKVDTLRSLRLSVPEATEIAYELGKRGIMFSKTVINDDELIEELERIRKNFA